MTNQKISKLSDEELIFADHRLKEIIQMFDTELNRPFTIENQTKRDQLLEEMFKRFQKDYRPPFKIGYSDGSGTDDGEEDYTITDTNDNALIYKGCGWNLSRVLVWLLNNHPKITKE